jgi:hypothetical protein
LRPLSLVLLDELDVPGTLWYQELGGGRSQVKIKGTARQLLASASLRGVLNRAVALPGNAIFQAHPDDRQYISSEVTAFALSWLHGLAPRLLNPPTATGLAGSIRSMLEWRTVAARAGLPVVPLKLDESTSEERLDSVVPTRVLVVNGRAVYPRVPLSVSVGLSRLSSITKTPLLEAYFSEVGMQTQLRFINATPHPEFQLFGDHGLVAIEQALMR